MKSIILTILSLSIVFQLRAQNVGVVKGRIVDQLNNQALPFVNVVVSGTTTGTTADGDGNFVISNLAPGYVTLTASFVGYETQVTRDVLVSNAKPAYIEIALVQSDTKLNEVQVKASPYKKTEESPVSLKTIGVSQIENNPGSNRDISKVIQSFPGVGGGASFRNDIIIRGGGPSESRFYLDGVEIPNLNHFATQGASGGPLGIINADFIGGVKYYSGAFPSTRGNALSGVFEFSQVDGNKDKLRFRASLGASEASLTADGPIGKKSTFIFSVRRSYLQFLFSALGLPFLPTYNDYQYKYRLRMGEKDELVFTGIGALDKFVLNTGIKNPDEQQQYILASIPVNEQWTYTTGAVYKHFREKGYHTFVLSRNMLNNVSYKYPDNDESKPRSLDYVSQEIENKARWEVTTRMGNWKTVYGLSGEYAKYNNSTKQSLLYQGQLQNVSYQSAIDLFKYGAFGQVSHKYLNERLTLSLGVRADANTYSASMKNPLQQLSPRFSLSYAISEQWTFNANTGRYYQMPAYTTLGYRDRLGVLHNAENNLRYIGANHYIAGFEYNPNPTLNFSLEGFYKQYDHYPVSMRDSIPLSTKGADFGVLGDEEVRSEGVGRAYGLELLNRTQLPSGFSMTLSYTLVRSEFQDSKGNYIPTTWDSKHLFTATLGQNFKRNWTVGARWRFIGGSPYTPYNLKLSANRAVWDAYGKPVLDNSALNSQRFSAVHQLNVRVDKKYYFPKWSLRVYFDIQNAYNFQAQSQDIVVREKNADGTYQLTNNNTDYVLRSIQNYSGTLLPSVGLIAEF